MRRVLSASREAVARLRSLRPRRFHLAIGLALLVTAALFLVAIRSPAVPQPGYHRIKPALYVLVICHSAKSANFRKRFGAVCGLLIA